MFSWCSGILAEAISIASTSLQQKTYFSRFVFAMSSHGRIIEKDWQLNSLFKNIRDSAIMLILWEEIKKQRDLEY